VAKAHVLKTDQTLCKLKKSELIDILPTLAAGRDECKFICRRCARFAPHKKMLCKPESIKKVARSQEASEP
jgi:hypothetical protein